MALPSLATLAVAPIPGLSDEVNQIRLDTASIVSEHIIPNEEILTGQTTEEERQSLVFELQTHIKAQNLWAPHLPKEYGGMGVGFIGHAYMNEILAWSPVSNHIFGVQAPTSGNRRALRVCFREGFH